MAKFLVIRHCISGKTLACEIEADTMREARDKAKEAFKLNRRSNHSETTIYVISKATKRTVITISAWGATLIKKEDRTDRVWKVWNQCNNLENITFTTELHFN